MYTTQQNDGYNRQTNNQSTKIIYYSLKDLISIILESGGVG